MKHHKDSETRYFKSYADDFVESKDQAYRLPESYTWVHDNVFYRLLSGALYLLVTLFAFPYCRLILHSPVQLYAGFSLNLFNSKLV